MKEYTGDNGKFKKGNPGRKKGSKSEKTKQWEVLGESIMNEHTERFNEELNKLQGKDFIQAYTQVLEYFKPKLQRTELKGELENKTTSLDNLTFEQLYELKYGRKPD